MAPAGARRAVETLVMRWDTFPKPRVARVEDLMLPAADRDVYMPARLYTPGPADRTPRPLLVYLHGGGYVVGSIDSHDSVCRLLARESGWLVLSVGYRLAPEHVFPSAHRDAYAAARWAARNAERLGADGRGVAVGGDGAGATLAAAVCQQAREAGGPVIWRQLLWYPQMADQEAKPCGSNADESGFLSAALMQWFMSHYLVDPAQRHSPLFNPLRHPDFRGLPPAFIMSAGLDPGKDASRAFADKLSAAGVPVQYRCMETTILGFLNMLGGIDLAAQAVRESGAYLRDARCERDGVSSRRSRKFLHASTASRTPGARACGRIS